MAYNGQNVMMKEINSTQLLGHFWAKICVNIYIFFTVLVTSFSIFSSAVGVKSATRRRSATTVITKRAVAVAWVSLETGCSARTPMTARRTHATPRMPWGAPMGTVVCVTSRVAVSLAGQRPTVGFLPTIVTRITALLLVSTRYNIGFKTYNLLRGQAALRVYLPRTSICPANLLNKDELHCEDSAQNI